MANMDELQAVLRAMPKAKRDAICDCVIEAIRVRKHPEPQRTEQFIAFIQWHGWGDWIDEIDSYGAQVLLLAKQATA